MKKNKKILILVNYLSFFLSHRLPVAEALLAKGFEVFIGYGELRGADPKLLEQKGFNVDFIPMQPGSFNLLKDLKTVYYIWVFFKRVKPDIVHLVTIKPYLYGGIVSRLCGVQGLVTAVSGLGTLFVNKDIKSKLIRLLLYPIYKLAFNHLNQKVIVQNKDDLKVLVNWGVLNPSKVKLLKGSGVNLEDFDGIVWTGSLLNIYDLGPSIERQIELAKNLFTKKNKIFGSCWGLQVLATAGGGSVRKNPKGLEAVIANNITLNMKGINHPMYKDKPEKFDSFCWHYDEVDELPQDASVLSSNIFSSVQSISFRKGNSEVWAVQYHPEFDSQWIADLMLQRKSLLLKERIYQSEHEFNNMYTYLADNKKFDYLKNELSICNSLIEESTHNLEISNFLKNIMNDN